ncbi:type VI secretion system protein [Gynuella sp.]|uniref:type VI secretion system protein n=1 Tax=Gynuella sp. TaxID=2969146 RepID=UPI003D0C162D
MTLMFYLLAALALVLLLILIRVVFRARLPQLPLKWPKRLNIRAGIRRWDGLKSLLRQLRTHSNARYGIPWIMVIGEPGSGKKDVVKAMVKGQKVRLLERDIGRSFKSQSVNLHDQGILLDLELSDKQSWQDALIELNNWRPERPIDSLVLMISATTLLEAEPARLQTLARRMYTQLWSLQKHLEFITPIYLLITQTEEVPGFASFWSAQTRYHDQMFGWSSPDSEEARFLPAWIDTAFDELQQQLYQLQSQFIAHGCQVGDADGFVLFPKHFDQLRRNLKTLSAILFHETVYKTGATVRGLYFCGRIDHNSPPIFLTELISRKIYPERNIGRPIRQAKFSRNQLIRRIQKVTLAGFAMLFLSLLGTSWVLKQNMWTQTQALRHINQIVDPHSDQMASSSTGECLSADQFFSLVRFIGEIRASDWYWNIPYSYPIFNTSSSPAKLSAGYVANGAIEKVIMPAIKCQLEHRIAEISSNLPQTLTMPPQQAEQQWSDMVDQLTGFAVQKSNFELLSRPVAQAEGLRKRAVKNKAQTLNDQIGMKTVSAFDALVKYIYDRSLESRYLSSEWALYHALLEVDYRDNQLVMPRIITEHLPQLLAQRTEELVTLHINMSAAGVTVLAGLASEQAARKEVRAFRRWHDYIFSTWLGGNDQDNHCLDLQLKLQTLIREWPQLDSAALEPSFSTQNCYRPIQGKLLQVVWNGDPIIKLKGNRQVVAWSDHFRFELEALKSLSEKKFMMVETRRNFNCSDKLLSSWNDQPVKSALVYLSEYQSFLQQQQALASTAGLTDIDPLYVKVGHKQIQRLMDTLVDQALPDADKFLLQQQELAPQSYAFNRAVDNLILVRSLYYQLIDNDEHVAWISCVDDYADQRLTVLKSLARETFQLSAGQGAQERLFPSLKDAPTTASYFQSELSRVQWLSDLASPYSAWFGATVSDSGDDPRRFWYSTIDELNRLVALKDKTGQAQQLDDFLNQVALPLDYEHCHSTLAEQASDTAEVNLFAARQVGLVRQAKAQCQSHIEAGSQSVYLALKEQFNRTLAGYFPFSDASAVDADPIDVEAFFSRYQIERDGLLTWADSQNNVQVREFLSDIDQVATMMNHLLVDGQIKPLNLQLSFRYAAARSPGSEQIVRWQFSNGSEQIFYPNGGSELAWLSGEPLQFTARWAERSPVQPQFDSHQTDLTVSGRSASFRQEGNWALIRFVRQYLDSSSPVSSRLALSFSVPVKATDDTQTSDLQNSILRLSMAFQVQDIGKQTWIPLSWPAVFPSRAPAI